MTAFASYTHFGGAHPETAAMANLLRAQGITAPHNDRPYSEALLLGIGGGLGAGYILWEFKEHNAKVLVLGFRNHWQYPVAYYQNLCERIGVRAAFRESSGRRTAETHLRAALAAGTPVIAWVDRAHMPYLQLPEALKGHIGHIVGVCGGDRESIYVDDLAVRPFRLSAETFADARDRIVSYKNRLLLVEPGAEAVDLPAAIWVGIEDCARQLLDNSESFSLPTFRKWAKTLADGANKKAWPTVFADGSKLYGVLASLFENVELAGTGGGALRGLYATFLEEASPILDRPQLRNIAEQYRALAGMWSSFAEAALPDEVEALGRTKELLRAKYRLLFEQADGAREAVERITTELRTLHAAHNRSFPLDETGRRKIFTTLRDRLIAIYHVEHEAASALQSVAETREGA